MVRRSALVAALLGLAGCGFDDAGEGNRALAVDLTLHYRPTGDNTTALQTRVQRRGVVARRSVVQGQI
ncbi:MAG: hypothetical protein EOO40_10965, partial [Deltaproteobacteria bacterium]